MKPTTRHPRTGQTLARRIVAGATLVPFLLAPPSAMAALTDISNAPLASASTAQIPPNVMFVLDNSGSMNSEYMPDSISGRYDSKRVGSVNFRCNTIFYNPNVVYPPAKNSDGTDFSDANFTSAEEDPYPSNSPSGSTDLRSKFSPWGGWSSQPAFYFVYTGTWPSDPALQDTECRVSASGADGTGKDGWTTGNWKKVEVQTAERQNFANWYQFYRTRLLLMKSAAGHAFVNLNDNFRVGFLTICPDGSSCNSDTSTVTVSSSDYLKIDGFTPSHKKDWYAKFYGQTGGSYTPLRQALSRVGRHYAGKTDGINKGMPDDPIQYSCQQNFAILTTDGYWNYGYGRKVDGTTMDQRDGDIAVSPRPMFDGGQMQTRAVYQRVQKWYDASRGSCKKGQEQLFEWTTTYEIVCVTPDGGSQTCDKSPGTKVDEYSKLFNSSCKSSYTIPPSVWTPASAPGTLVSSTTGFAGGPDNTLADVAEYYYRTDLRPAGSKNAKGDDVSLDNVPAAGVGSEDDKAPWQHMTTFTLGLGVSGQLNFKQDYKSGAGDFAALRNGTAYWPDPNPWNSNGASSSENLARIDDLWHAAVNGRGQSFSATDPVSLAVSLQTALSAIQVRLSSAAAAATSSLEPTLTDRLVFTPTYTTGEWSGDVQAHQIDLSTGAVLDAVVWSAQALLDQRTSAACDTRKIFLHRAGYNDGTSTTNLVPFTWNTDTCDTSGNPSGSPVTNLDSTELAFFGATQVSSFTQYLNMTNGTSGTVDQPTIAAGKDAAQPAVNLVNFVRGQRGNEDFTPDSATRLFRARKHVLGDVVNSQPVYVRQPYFDYADTGYSEVSTGFKATQQGRKPMVYVAANDGVLHAFNGADVTDPTFGADAGKEVWAIVPRAVLPRIHRLADTNWAQLHEYSVDATPTVGDVYFGGAWHTIVVAGLNKGGRAYYAIDVTNPDKPVMLWEFNNTNDPDVGYAFGNPIITKLESGQWVVLVTSGLNNVSPGDGRGYLYVLNPANGAIIHKIGTGVGDTGTPSGLTKIRNWVSGNGSIDNTTARVYGVDLLGHIWRFDVNDHLVKGSPSAELLAKVEDATNVGQPLTTRPELAEVGSPPVPYVYVSTGRYLGTTDVTNTQKQSIYAIKDPLTSPVTLGAAVVPNLRTALTKRTMTTVGSERFTCTGPQQTAGDPTCDPNVTNGWFVDLIDTGERVNVDMKLQLGTLVVASNVPGNTACEPGGYSYKNYFDYATGLSPAGATEPIGSRLSNALAVGINIIRLPDGRIVVIGMDSSGTPQTFEAPIASGAPTGKRVTWREIAM